MKHRAASLRQQSYLYDKLNNDYVTFDVQAEPVEFASDGSSSVVVVELLTVTPRLAGRYDLSSWVPITTLDVQCEAVHSTHYHEVLLYSSTATTAYNHSS